MNRKVKMIVFAVSVILTVGTLHATVGRHHGWPCGREMEMRHCGFMHHHDGCEKKMDCPYKSGIDSSKVIHSQDVKKDTLN